MRVIVIEAAVSRVTGVHTLGHALVHSWFTLGRTRPARLGQDGEENTRLATRSDESVALR
jgi:hypothetical protein